MDRIFDVALASLSFGAAVDPGFIYLLRDRGRYKVGRTTSPSYRLRVARTWIPDIEILAMKPFWYHSEFESFIHVGLAMFAYKGEWFDYEGDEFEEIFISEFQYFTDEDPVRNTHSFPYFLNGTAMSEFTLEWSGRKVSKRRFLKENSFHSEVRGQG